MTDFFLCVACAVSECNIGLNDSECIEPCGHCRDGNQCSKINGSCLTGCDAGFKGDLCETSESTTTNVHF